MQKVQTSSNGLHRFSLIQLKANCHYTSIFADFTPPPNMNKASNSIVPAFLNDHNYFTPSFIIPRQKECYESTLPVEKEKFKARILKDNRLCQDEIGGQKNGEILQPPIPTPKYCQICKSSFASYENHLKDVKHQRQSRFSRANNYISQLCKKYSKTRQILGAKEKAKLVKKQKNQRNIKKSKPTKNKNLKTNRELIIVIKGHNNSTDVASIIIPAPY